MKEKIKSIRLRINKIGCKRRCKKLKIKNPTIISNNCYAGIISQYLGIRYYTPTIGLYFFAEDYIRFLSNFEYYIKQPLKIINTKESKHYSEMIEKKHENAIVGTLDDVEIVFLHYHNENEIKDKWNKRIKRINYDCIIFKFCDQNSCTDKLIEEFDKLPFENKICFTSKAYKGLKSVVYIKSDKNKNEVQRDYYKSHRYFNIIKYINQIYEKKVKD